MNFTDFITAILTGVSLAMDAFAIAITNGMVHKKEKLTLDAVKTGLMFGFFQFFMPMLGYYASGMFISTIQKYDHYIALILLSFLGGKMIYESVKEIRSGESSSDTGVFSIKTLLIQAIATSIDALAIGITYAVMSVSKTQSLISCIIIGIVTFIISFLGMFLGKKFGGLFRQKAAIAGGIILILIGLKIFIFDIFSL